MIFSTIKGIKIVPFFKQIGQFPHEITLLKNWEFARLQVSCIYPAF